MIPDDIRRIVKLTSEGIADMAEKLAATESSAQISGRDALMVLATSIRDINNKMLLDLADQMTKH